MAASYSKSTSRHFRTLRKNSIKNDSLVDMMISEQIGKSEDNQNIRQVISIIITEEEFISSSSNCHHRFTMYDSKNELERPKIYFKNIYG